MKKAIYITLASIAILLSSCNQQKALDYNDLCVNNVSNIILKYNEYNDHVGSDSINFDTLEKLRTEGIAIAKKTIDILTKTETFDGDKKFKSSALIVAQSYLNIFDNTFKKDLELAKNVENATVEEIKANDEAIDMESQKISVQTKELEIAQKEFCAKYNVRIDPGKH